MVKRKSRRRYLLIALVGLLVLFLTGLLVYRTLTHRRISATPRLTSPAAQQALRARYQIQRFDDLPYGPEGDEAETSRRLDVVAPLGATNLPSLVIVHGGGWTSGGRQADHVQRIAEWFAKRGVIAVPLDCRLVPEVSLYDMVRDVADGVAWVHRHVAEYGGDPQRIFLLGHSSGAHLNALLACDRQYLDALAVPREVPAGVVAIAGIYDLRDPRKTSTIIGRPAVRILFGAGEELLRRLSPVLYVHEGMPPFLLLNGQGDDLIQPEQTVGMERAMREVGASCTVAVIARRNHQTIFSNIPKPGDGAAEAIMWFIQ